MIMRWTVVRTAALAAVLLGVGWAAGCSKGGKQESAGGPPKVITGDPKQEVAKLNNEVITLADVDKIVQMWKSGRIQGVDPNTPEGELQKRAVDQLIGTKLLYAEAVKAGTVPSDDEVNLAIQQMKQSNGLDDSTFTRVLKEQGVTLDELKQNYRTEQAVRKYVKTAIQDTLKVTPEQAKSYYDTHQEEFKHPEQIHGRHILVQLDPAATPDQVQAAKARAEAITQDLRKGTDFGKEAEQKSDDKQSGSRGGDLGMLNPGQMPQPLDSVAFGLQPGLLYQVRQGRQIKEIIEDSVQEVIDYFDSLDPIQRADHLLPQKTFLIYNKCFRYTGNAEALCSRFIRIQVYRESITILFHITDCPAEVIFIKNRNDSEL